MSGVRDIIVVTRGSNTLWVGHFACLVENLWIICVTADKENNHSTASKEMADVCEGDGGSWLEKRLGMTAFGVLLHLSNIEISTENPSILVEIGVCYMKNVHMSSVLKLKDYYACHMSSFNSSVVRVVMFIKQLPPTGIFLRWLLFPRIAIRNKPVAVLVSNILGMTSIYLLSKRFSDGLIFSPTDCEPQTCCMKVSYKLLCYGYLQKYGHFENNQLRLYLI